MALRNTPPSIHKAAAFLEQVASHVSLFDLIAAAVGKHGLRYLSRKGAVCSARRSPNDKKNPSSRNLGICSLQFHGFRL